MSGELRFQFFFLFGFVVSARFTKWSIREQLGSGYKSVLQRSAELACVIWWSRCSRFSTWARASCFWDYGPVAVLPFYLSQWLCCSVAFSPTSTHGSEASQRLCCHSWWKPWLYSLFCFLVFVYFLFFSMIEMVLFATRRTIIELGSWVCMSWTNVALVTCFTCYVGCFCSFTNLCPVTIVLFLISRILAKLQIMRRWFTLTAPFRPRLHWVFNSYYINKVYRFMTSLLGLRLLKLGCREEL